MVDTHILVWGLRKNKEQMRVRKKGISLSKIAARVRRLIFRKSFYLVFWAIMWSRYDIKWLTYDIVWNIQYSKRPYSNRYRISHLLRSIILNFLLYTWFSGWNTHFLHWCCHLCGALFIGGLCPGQCQRAWTVTWMPYSTELQLSRLRLNLHMNIAKLANLHLYQWYATGNRQEYHYVAVGNARIYIIWVLILILNKYIHLHSY